MGTGPGDGVVAVALPEVAEVLADGLLLADVVLRVSLLSVLVSAELS